jgi:hypothetical protein
MEGKSIPISTEARRHWWCEIYAELAASHRLHAPLVFLISLYICSLVIVTLLLNVVDKISLSVYNDTIPLTIFLFCTAFFVGHAICVMIFIRPKKLIKYIFKDLRINYVKKERLLNALPIFLYLPLFMSAFTAFKTIIPIMNPFSWDLTLAKMDAMIHGGYQAWQLLQPIFGYPLLTSIINFFYNLWLFIMFGVLYWQAFSLRDPKLRMQFFLSFVISWAVLGTGLATLFSSAGPCYYGMVVMDNDVYQPLMEYLNNVQESYPIWALDTQEMLWKTYKNNEVDLGSGISAMPSMHVSTSVLFALVGWRTHRLLGIVFSIFAAIIMLGSIHLGWHYAIDGYAAIFCTFLIWSTAGIFLRHNAQIDANRKWSLR